MISTSIRVKDNPAPAPAPPPPPPAAQDIEFSYNSQDSVVMQSQPTVVKGVGDGPSVEKATLIGGLQPNADGKYVYGECDTPNVTAAISFSSVAKTIETMSAALGQPINWAFEGPKLGVIPDDGEDFNAYYARDQESVHFFHGTDPVTNKTVMSGASGEVCSHECGHAILDGLRPGYFSSWTPDVGAFHESFGDMVGMLMAFQDDRTLGRAAIQTGGDLSKPNCIADTGEQLGVAINDFVGQDVTGGNFVRTARNDFKWADPSTLPDSSPDPNQLGSEVHSFSRLWTGAFYDVLNGVNQRNVASGMEPKDALKATGDEGLKLLTNLLKQAPQGDFTYRDMANAFVQSDKDLNAGKNADIITKAMTDRGILGDAPAPIPDPPAPAAPNPPSSANRGLYTSTASGRKPLADLTRTVTIKLSGPEFGMFNGAKVQTLVDKDGGLSKDAEVTMRTRSNLAKLIGAGKIRYNDPSYQMKPADYFDPKSKQPYTGVVKWENGEMHIERVKIAT